MKPPAQEAHATPTRRPAVVGRMAVAVGVAVALCATLWPSAASSAGQPPTSGRLAPMAGSYVFTLRFDGAVRDYRVHVPPAARSGRPLPLVLNLHGATQNATGGGDRLGHGPVSPTATGTWSPTPTAPGSPGSWPPTRWPSRTSTGGTPGMCCGLPVSRHVDDVGFLLHVICRHRGGATPVDLRRVYMTGISNGGMMAYALASKASEAHRGGVLGVGAGGAAPHPPQPTRAHHGVPLRRRPHRQMGRGPEPEPCPPALSDGGDRPVGPGGRMLPLPPPGTDHRGGHRDDVGRRDGDAESPTATAVAARK